MAHRNRKGVLRGAKAAKRKGTYEQVAATICD